MAADQPERGALVVHYSNVGRVGRVVMLGHRWARILPARRYVRWSDGALEPWRAGMWTVLLPRPLDPEGVEPAGSCAQH